MEEKLYIGCHVGMNSPEFYLGSVKEALSYGANTFMFYTGAPQNSFRKPVNELRISEGRELLKQHNIDESKIIVHAPYIINACNITKPELYDLSIKLIVNELQRTSAFNVKTMVLHPGAHVGQGREVAIDALAKALDSALEQDGTDVKIALETMSGKGTEVGITFEEIAEIISKCNHKDRLGVCFDTCHTHDAGYNLFDFDDVLEEFDRIIGLDRLLVVHLNDSKNVRGAHKDRHENIGYGEIGFEILNKVASSPKLKGIPIILETPYYNEKPPYKQEIKMLKEGKFVPNWRDNL